MLDSFLSTMNNMGYPENFFESKICGKGFNLTTIVFLKMIKYHVLSKIGKIWWAQYAKDSYLRSRADMPLCKAFELEQEKVVNCEVCSIIIQLKRTIYVVIFPDKH